MYAHARYYIILLRNCTKVIKVCKRKTGKQSKSKSKSKSKKKKKGTSK